MSVFFCLEPALDAVKVNVFDSTSALTNLKKRILNSKFVIPAKSALWYVFTLGNRFMKSSRFLFRAWCGGTIFLLWLLFFLKLLLLFQLSLLFSLFFFSSSLSSVISLLIYYHFLDWIILIILAAKTTWAHTAGWFLWRILFIQSNNICWIIIIIFCNIL